MKHIFYDLIFWLYGIVALPFFILKGKHRDAWAERWGKLPRGVHSKLGGRPVFWIHAVSIGEARLACHLVRTIRRRIPGVCIVMTTTTQSGRLMARDRLAPEDVLVYFPFDLSFVVRRFLNTIQPSIAVFMETELWPNLIGELDKRNIPLVVANARISDRAFPKYRCIAFILKHTLKRIDRCLAQSEIHRKRFIQLGVPEERVVVTGNLKFDLEVAAQANQRDLIRIFGQMRKGQQDLILLAASTHLGEEMMILTVFQKLKCRFPHNNHSKHPTHR